MKSTPPRSNLSSARGLLIDTGYLIGLTVPRDQYHDQAKRVLSELRRRRVPVRCPLGSALELQRALLYTKPPRVEAARQTVEGVLRAYPLVMPSEEDVRSGMEGLARFNDQAISLTDAITASMARREGLAVLTFDVRHYSLLGAELYEG